MGVIVVIGDLGGGGSPIIIEGGREEDSTLRKLLSDRVLAGDATDISAADTEVGKFAIAHAAKFGDGFAILEPVVERALNVHVAAPFVCSVRCC